MEANRKASAAAATLAVERGGGAWQDGAVLMKVIIRISWDRISGSGYPVAGTRIPFTHNDNLLSGQNGSGAKRKSERKGSSSAGEIQTFGIRKYEPCQTQDSYFSEE